MVLLSEAAHALEGSNDEGDGRQLSLGVADLIFIEGEGLQEKGKSKQL